MTSIANYKFYITGVRRGLGKALKDKMNYVDSLEECDIFINNKHDGFEQVEYLYSAVKLGKRVINIGSHASDFTSAHKYAVEKKALREANHQLFVEGHNTTCINFGYIDTERSADKKVKKMSINQAIETIDWVINYPLRVKEITVCP
jgi:citrate lyase synthetase|tara:strand:+ start:65 stop:505 length:441 start_codon:yes stop_codon:yes gene_type:complete